MAGSRFLRVFSALERRRGWVFAGLAVAVFLAGLVLTQVRFDNTLDLMLPTDSPAQRMMTFLRESNFSNKIVISLEARGPDVSRASLLAAADSLAASLGPPLVTKVIKGFTTPDLMQDAGVFLGYTSQLLDVNDLAAVERSLTPDGVDALLKQHYLQLLKPEGMFMAKAIQSDPLNLNRLIMTRLQTLSASLDYDVTIEDGHFLSRDGRHALLVAETSVPMTDAAGSRRLLDYLAGKLHALPSGIRASPICGHLHVVSNDAVIKRDLGVILGIASIGFMALYLAFFRDPRGLLVFLMPALAAVIAMAVTSLWFPKLSYFVLAFGPVIAGIADDYGIASYVAVRYGRHPGEAVRHIAKPVLVGAITTTAIFFAFFFSHIPGYRQLACFCILSVFLAVALALFVLPLCIRQSAPVAEPTPDVTTSADRRRRNLLVAALFTCFLAVAGLFAAQVRFDSDVTRLDGTDPAILQSEAAFQKVWGVRDQRDAMLVVVSSDYEKTLELNDAMHRQSATLAGTNRFVTLASVWPSRQTRDANARQWTTFWQNGREATLRRLLAERGAVYGFATNAFEPFFAGLAASNELPVEPASNLVFSSLKDRFVQTPNGRVQALSYFPDDPALVQAFAAATQGRDDVFIVSRSVLGGILSDAFSGEVVRTSLLAGVLIVVTAFLFLRRASLTLIALTPALAGVVGLLAGMAALHRPLNVANLISGVVVFGLCIDFGVHVLHACIHRENRTTRMAVTFAAATTLMGSGVLLFARHPALFSIGFTLFIGVGLGYVTAMWVVPALCGLLPQQPVEEGHA